MRQQWVVCLLLVFSLVTGSPAVCLAQAQDLDNLNAQVTKLYNEGKYADAVPLAQKYAEAIKEQFGNDDPKYATALNNLARLYEAQDRYAEAEPLYKRSLSIRVKKLGPDHLGVAFSLKNLAWLYRRQGLYTQAEPHYKRALAILEKKLGPDHEDVATSLKNLAELYQEQGRYAQAEPSYKRSLGIVQKLFGPNHVYVATSINSLAVLYEGQGRYAEAEPLYKRSQAILEKERGLDHEDVATNLNNLAGLYIRQARYAEAEPLVKRSLSIREMKLGPNHLDVALSLSTLARLYKAQGRYAEAEWLVKRTLAIRKEKFGPDHEDVASSLNNLATLYADQGRYAEAEPLYRLSLAIYEKVHGPDHEDVATSLNNLAVLYDDQGRYAEAEPLYERSLEIYGKAHRPDHPRIALSLGNLAALYASQGRYADAESLHKRSLSLREKELGLDHVDVATTLNSLAVLYDSQGRYAEAEPLYRRSLGIYEKALGPDHPNVATRLNNLAGLYRTLNRLEEAEALFKRADAIPDPTTKKVRVYFATNRLLERTGPAAKYGTERGKRLEIGQANVIVPTKELETRTSRLYSAAKPASFAQSKLTSPTQLVIREINRIQEGETFAGKLKDLSGRSSRFKNQALVFVHGFNVSFDDAVSRAAQLCFELEFDGPCLVFSWPSAERLFGYVADRDSAEIAVDFLVEIIERLAADLPDTKIHLMAHSMGNLVTLQALEKLALKTGSGSKINIGEVVLAHADVDSARFTQLIKNARPLGAGFTLYSSKDDWALWVSELMRGVTRAGGTIVLSEGLDTIDVTGLGANFLSFNHSVFAENPIVFGDITKLLQTGERPPDSRTELFEAVDKDERKYWRYKAATPVTDTRTEGGLDLIDVLGSGQ